MVPCAAKGNSEGKDHPAAFISHKFITCEEQYLVIEKLCLAIKLVLPFGCISMEDPSSYTHPQIIGIAEQTHRR